MALDTNAALLKLNPITPLGLDLPDRKQASMERERLKLMREQFEEAKRQNVEDNELRRMHEAGEMTRARMQTERLEAQAKAEAAAELLKQKRAAHEAMLKYEDAGDFEGMSNAANQLNELGGRAELLGTDEQGFPAWQVDLDGDAAREQEAQQEERAATYGPRETAPQSLDRLGALGYPSLSERGNLDGTGAGEAPPLSTEDAFRSAQHAARGPDEVTTEPAPAADPNQEPAPWSPETLAAADEADAAQNYAEPGRSTPMAPPPGLEPSIFQATGRPARKPAAPDLMGGVPKNSIDTGAMAAATKQRLGPVMANIEASMPQAYRESTRLNNEASTSMGLPADKALDRSLQLRGASDAATARELDAERDAEKARLAKAPKELTRMDIDSLAEGGEKRAKETFDNLGIDEVPRRVAAAHAMIDILEDDDPNNDNAIAFELPNMLGSKGAQSNRDLAVALGLDGMSTFNQIKERITRIINGGFTEMRKDSLAGIIKKKIETDEESVFGFLDAIDESSARATDPDVRRGLLDYAARNVPKEYRDAHGKAKGGAGEPSAAGQSAPSGATGTAVPDVEGETRIPETSRIAYVHNNPGNLIFDKDNPEGAEPGEDKEGGGRWAKFPTVDAGLSALRAHIGRHGDLSLAAYISKYAPKKDGNDTEKHIADAVAELKAEPGDLVDEVDAYDLMRFIARHESSTELPYQYAKVDEKNRKLERHAAAVEAASPPTAAGTDDAALLEGLE